MTRYTIREGWRFKGLFPVATVLFGRFFPSFAHLPRSGSNGFACLLRGFFGLVCYFIGSAPCFLCSSVGRLADLPPCLTGIAIGLVSICLRAACETKGETGYGTFVTKEHNHPTRWTLLRGGRFSQADRQLSVVAGGSADTYEIRAGRHAWRRRVRGLIFFGSPCCDCLADARREFEDSAYWNETS